MIFRLVQTHDGKIITDTVECAPDHWNLLREVLVVIQEWMAQAQPGNILEFKKGDSKALLVCFNEHKVVNVEKVYKVEVK